MQHKFLLLEGSLVALIDNLIDLRSICCNITSRERKMEDRRPSLSVAYNRSPCDSALDRLIASPIQLRQ
jgi:hypothetical protein